MLQLFHFLLQQEFQTSNFFFNSRSRSSIASASACAVATATVLLISFCSALSFCFISSLRF
jgi:hypothetical protein